jgi:hypothetical protein
LHRRLGIAIVLPEGGRMGVMSSPGGILSLSYPKATSKMDRF